MSFWQRLAFFTDFIKDLFFDTAEEGRFSSSQFNTRKFTIFMLVLVLVSLTTFLGNLSFKLFKKVEVMKTEMSACHCVHKEEPKKEGEKKE